MKKGFLLKTVFISFLSHLAAFGFFSFSFSGADLSVNYPQISFWGGILDKVDFIPPDFRHDPLANKIFPLEAYLPKESKTGTIAENSFAESSYFKPPVQLAINTKKTTFERKFDLQPPILAKKESSVMFHPALPYYFGLYFKDRQVVHIELMYNLASNGKSGSLTIKRKISSGNLEVDLLCMHYISHYLFIQQARLIPNTWQTVKIEFSSK